MDVRLNDICRALNYQFSHLDLLEEALTHSSACPVRGRGAGGTKPRASYERLEFLGDRVLGLAVAGMLFRTFPRENEGALARRHAALVRRETLARVAIILGLDQVLVMSKGEEDGGGRNNPTILADACEAVLGAVYADGGLEPAGAIVERLWEPLMAESVTPPKDCKTGLQEWAQGRGKPLPEYQTLGVEGPQHDPIFLVSVTVEGFAPVTGQGNSKRVAEQAAASAMLEKVTK
jgi:ribonuclease-3